MDQVEGQPNKWPVDFAGRGQGRFQEDSLMLMYVVIVRKGGTGKLNVPC